MKIKFSECVKYMVKGPFGSDMKKSLYVPKGEDTYKVYVQGNAIQKDENLGDYYIQSEYFHQKLKRFEVHPGDYIITCDGTLGKYIKLSENIERGVISSSLLLLKLDEEVIYDKYFELLWDNSMLSYLASQARNACLVHLPSAKTIGEIIINLPELSVQREMADKAFLIVNIIQQRNKELSMLDDLIKARFVEMFGDPKFNDKDWNVATILDYYDVKGGKRIPKGMGYSESVTKHPYLRATDMKNATIVDDDIHYIDDEVYEYIKRYTVKNGDVYLTNVGVNLGMAGVIPDKYDGANLTENAVKLVPKKEKVIDGVFLSHYINSPGIQEYINERKMSVGVPKLAIFRIETMPLLLPPMKLQNQFADFVNQVNKSKVEVQKALDETQKLFDSLMQQYFG